MIYTGKLAAVELYDSIGKAGTNVKKVWDSKHNDHQGHCIVANAHWFNPGPDYCGNYRIDGKTLSFESPDYIGFAWNSGEEPQFTKDIDNHDNFVCTIPAIVNGQRQSLNYGAGVERSTTRTWFGEDSEGNWTIEVTTSNYTLDGIVDRMESLGIINGMVFDGSGSSQWYDGSTRIKGDGRIIYSYLILWFSDGFFGEGDKGGVGAMFSFKTGIDVSKWQGTIDWEKAKADGVEFAMLRAGYGRNNIDEQFERNISECNRLGIPCGIYWFSYAYTEEMAEKEAEYALQSVSKFKLEYPIAFDFEGDSVNYAAKNGVVADKELVSAMARAFCKRIEQGKYYAMLYTNPSYLSEYFDTDIPGEFDIWLAKWPTNPDPSEKPSQAGGIWQYTNSGDVNGISGRVDMDAAYIDYPSVISKAGLNGLDNTEEDVKPIEPEQPNEPEQPIDYETEKRLAREFVIKNGISDGERGRDPLLREEYWVMIYRQSRGGEK